MSIHIDTDKLSGQIASKLKEGEEEAEDQPKKKGKAATKLLGAIIAAKSKKKMLPELDNA